MCMRSMPWLLWKSQRWFLPSVMWVLRIEFRYSLSNKSCVPLPIYSLWPIYRFWRSPSNPASCMQLAKNDCRVSEMLLSLIIWAVPGKQRTDSWKLFSAFLICDTQDVKEVVTVPVQCLWELSTLLEYFKGLYNFSNINWSCLKKLNNIYKMGDKGPGTCLMEVSYLYLELTE